MSRQQKKSQERENFVNWGRNAIWSRAKKKRNKLEMKFRCAGKLTQLIKLSLIDGQKRRKVLTWWLFHRRQNCWLLSFLEPFNSTDVSIIWWCCSKIGDGDKFRRLFDKSWSRLFLLLRVLSSSQLALLNVSITNCTLIQTVV